MNAAEIINNLRPQMEKLYDAGFAAGYDKAAKIAKEEIEKLEQIIKEYQASYT